MCKRSNEKRITKEATILRCMRQMSGFSFSEAGRFVNISGTAVAHMEHGRMAIPAKRIEALVKAYGFTLEDYEAYFQGKEVPINQRDECIAMIRLLDEKKLSIVYGLLTNFAK